MNARPVFKLLGLIICLVAITAEPTAMTVATLVGFRQETAVAQALRDLRGPDERLRESAKSRLLSGGSTSIEPIISLLSDLLDTGASPVTFDEPKQNVALRDIVGDSSEDETNWRLVIDCCWLLGQLKAARAVPLLIKVIEVHEIFSLLPKRVTEINALVLIGKAAEPALLNELREARQKAVTLVGRELPDGDARKLRAQERKAREIQLQVGAALALIGDDDTIAALERLFDSAEFLDGSGRSVIESTISQIRARNYYRTIR